MNIMFNIMFNKIINYIIWQYRSTNTSFDKYTYKFADK